MRDWRNAVFVEQFWKQPHHHFAVFQHVAHTAGHTQVVFQHVILSRAGGIGRAHDVNATDVRVDIARHIYAHHLRPKLRVLENLLGRHDASLQNFLAVVDVVNESVECRDPLYQAFFHAFPLMRGNDPGNQVKRDQSLSSRAVFVFFTVHREGDTNAPENHLGFFAPRLHANQGLTGKPALVNLIVLAHSAGAGIHLIKHRSAHAWNLRLFIGICQQVFVILA